MNNNTRFIEILCRLNEIAHLVQWYSAWPSVNVGCLDFMQQGKGKLEEWKLEDDIGFDQNVFIVSIQNNKRVSRRQRPQFCFQLCH